MHWQQPPACTSQASACWGLPLLLLHCIAQQHSSGQNTWLYRLLATAVGRVGRSYQLMEQHQGDGLHGEMSPGKFVTAKTGDKLEASLT